MEIKIKTILASFLVGASALPGFDSRQFLTYAPPEAVGMLSQPLRDMVPNMTAYTKAANYGRPTFGAVHPIQPGGVVMVGHAGKIVSHFAFGKRNLYADVNGTLLPWYEQEDATLDTVYDMASLTKLFTTIAVLREMDRGRVALNATVATYLPEFAVNGKADITIRMLLTHTSGFDADPSPSLYSGSYPTYEEKVKAILEQKILNKPGSVFLYSDLNFMTAMLVVEQVSGRRLDDLVYEFTRPLGMYSTFFNRGNLEGPEGNLFYYQTATQEFQIAVLGPDEPQRPQPVRGTVHDENAWALDGVSGHAGLFSTVADTAKVLQMILNNGTYAGHRILSQQSVDLIFTNLNAYLDDIDSAHGAGFELDQYYTCGPLYSPLSASHTGFTGTSVVVDRGRDLFYIQFSNRVHPSRNWSSNNILREILGYWVGKSLGVDVEFP